MIKNISSLDDYIKFLRILAGRTGQELNIASISEASGLSRGTIKEWLSILEASFIITRMQPYHRNYSKRIVKAPKLYFTDTGLACHLLGIRKQEEIDYHFLKGSLFETFIITEFLKYNYNSGEPFHCYFWRDKHQKEIDLIIDAGTGQYAAEMKSGATIHESYFDTLSWWSSVSGTDPSSLFLIYGGDSSYVRSGMHVVSWKHIRDGIIRRTVE